MASFPSSSFPSSASLASTVSSSSTATAANNNNNGNNNSNPSNVTSTMTNVSSNVSSPVNSPPPPPPSSSVAVSASTSPRSGGNAATRFGYGLLRKLSFLSLADSESRQQEEPLLSRDDLESMADPLPDVEEMRTPSLAGSLNASPMMLVSASAFGHPQHASSSSSLTNMMMGHPPTCAVCNSPYQPSRSVLLSPSSSQHRVHPSALFPSPSSTPSRKPIPSMSPAPLKASLASQCTIKQRILFILIVLTAITLRFLAVMTVTTENSMWVTMTVRHKHLDLAKAMFQRGYLPEMLGDLYHAGAYSTFAMMLIGAVIVPLVRISLVLACFFVPVRIGSGEERRTRTLFMLDHVGRFILIDVFAIGYGAVFSYKDIRLLEHLFPPNIPGAANSIVEDIHLTLSTQLFPTFYCGIISNVLGTLLTHKMLLMTIPKHPLSDKDMEGRTTLFGRFSMSRRAQFKWYQTSSSLVFVVLLAMACFVHLAVLRAPIISFKTSGFTGEIAPGMNEEVVFDLWTLVFKMPTSIYYDQDSKGFQYFGAYVLAFVYVLVILSIPLTLMVAALALLTVPMHKEFQYQVLFSSPFWFSWCSIDIFFFFTVSEYFEMDPISKYMTRIQYPEFCSFVEQRFKMDCTGVDTAFYPGIYSLAILCVALGFIRARFLWLYEQMSLHQTEERLPVIL